MVAPMTRKAALATLTAAAVLMGANAIACPPPPPGPPQEVGESDEAYAQRIAAFRAAEEAQHQAWLLARQQRVWDEATSVFVARVERVGTSNQDNLDGSPRVTLRPIRPLKGQRYASRFTLGYTEMTSCGPIPSFDAIRGQVGETFVVFVQGGRPRQSTVQQAIAVANITDPRIRAALEANE